MRIDWRWKLATKIRYAGWWLLSFACRVAGGHTFLDRLQQQCHVCATNIMFQGRWEFSWEHLRSLGLARALGLGKRPAKREWPACDPNLKEQP